MGLTTRAVHGRVFTQVGDVERAQLIFGPERLFEFVTTNVQPLFAIADAVETELVKVTK